MKAMRKPQLLANVLAQLGTTAQDVSDKLTAEGCFGYCGDKHNCPVSNYLKKLGFKGPVVDNHVFTGDLGAYVTTPEPILRFIRQFDIGLFPQLKATRP